jgi:hypothetical protein
LRTDNIIKHEGFFALAEKLDMVEIERFIMLLKKENSDYTEWRKDLFENMTIEELSKKAMDHYNK